MPFFDENNERKNLNCIGLRLIYRKMIY